MTAVRHVLYVKSIKKELPAKRTLIHMELRSRVTLATIPEEKEQVAPYRIF